MTILIKVHDQGTMPNVLPQGEWIDLHAAEDVELKAPCLNVHTNKIEFQTGLISLGVGIKAPKGYEVHIAPRSSTFKRWGIIMSNSIGIGDNSFSGNEDVYQMPYIAFRDAKINKGDRIAQFRIIKSQMAEGIHLVQTENLDDSNRGGIGSTGV